MNTKYLLFIFAVLVALIVIFLFATGTFDRKEPQSTGEVPPAQQDAPQGVWETKTDDQPPVTVKVTPLELGEDAEVWMFAITFDTHSGSLSDDLLTAATLADDKGNAHAPTAWEGSVPGGHHREGVLVFDVISPTPSQVVLKVKNVGGVAERTFTWKLE